MNNARHFGLSQRTRSDLSPTDFALLEAPGTKRVGRYALEDAKHRQAALTPRRRFNAPRARLVVLVATLAVLVGLAIALLRVMPL